jgi:predicted N-formylglutamate amidohydrolase
LNDFVIVTCEHGGNRVPAAFARLFRPHRELLQSHRGHDPGALDLARACARRLGAPLHFATVTRLLVELNRSSTHRALFSSITKSLPPDVRASLVEKHYLPYRREVTADMARAIAAGHRAVHFSMHTFTPVLDGSERRADVGLLYDPRRPGEAALCAALRRVLLSQRPDLIVRMNYPYQGKADGFTTALRKSWQAMAYVGIEIEINQKWPLGKRGAWRRLVRDVSQAIETVVRPSAHPGPSR